jgi:hypothetical protein
MGEFCDFFNFEFANVQNDGIFFTIGCGSPVYTAAVVSVKGGNSENNFLNRFIESVGRYVCTGATVYASSTPAGSFFVPDVEVRGKSQTVKTLYTGGSTWTVPFCSHTVPAANNHAALSASITVCGGEL